MSVVTTPKSVNIRPGVSVLSVLRHLNYKSWYALAEFVDNALQSYLANRARLGGTGAVLTVEISLSPEPPGRLIIRDNAAGIEEGTYSRAFRPAEVPPDRSGLSEFGMGMKSAACWFSPRWRVRTSALGESTEKTVSFDIATIVRDSIEEVSVDTRPAPLDQHFTEIVLEDLYRLPQTSTVRKVKAHLASIYRMFTRDGSLRLLFNGELLVYTDPPILHAPHYENETGPQIEWRKAIEFDFGGGLAARGFAALRERASTSEAGFALFRRRRLIQGSADEGYRPERIFGKSNSYRYQRLFGELELEGFEVSHTKDGFAWDDNEETFLELLRERLDAEPMPLLRQAEEHRTLRSRRDIQAAVEAATDRTAHALQHDVPPVLERIENSADQASPPAQLQVVPLVTRRQIDLELGGVSWELVLELTDDPAMVDWVELSDTQALPSDNPGRLRRRVSLRLALSHPFMVRFGGADAEQLEPLIRLAAAVVLAEVAARDSGVTMASTFRRNINALLREGLSQR